MADSSKRKDAERDADRDYRMEFLADDAFRDIYKDIIPPPQPKVNDMIEEDSNSSYQEIEETVEIDAPRLDNLPQPIESFESQLLTSNVRKAIKMIGLKKPTAIQKHSSLRLTSDTIGNDRI